jgi:transposase
VFLEGCIDMLERRDRLQDELFVAGSLRELIPEDHVLVGVDRVLDLSWLRAEVSGCYDLSQGRPGIDPEAAVRLMLAGLLVGIVEDRRLLREAQVNLAIRWFAGYRLHERLPDHSSLTRIRQRWGAERFRSVFERTVLQCVEAGLAKGDLVHLDATLIRADVSWESLVRVHLDAVSEANEERPSGGDGGGSGGGGSKPGRTKKISRTDPQARMATSHRKVRLEPSYKQLTAVDGAQGVVLDAEAVIADIHEGGAALEQLDRIAERTGLMIATVTADKAYAYGRNYAALEARGVRAVIPPQRTGRSGMPMERFKYDAVADLARCPRGRILRPAARYAGGRFYRARRADCQACPLGAACLPRSVKSRSLMIGDGYPALLRARRRHRRKLPGDRAAARSHRARVEGVHGEAKARHGLARAARRGLANVAIQAYLTAAVINLKRLAKALLRALLRPECPWNACTTATAAFTGATCDRMRPPAPMAA